MQTVRITCRACEGDGWVVVAAHGCGGDDRLCARICPVPEQEQCEVCQGNGYIEEEIEGEEE